jgi:hypothetical protein
MQCKSELADFNPNTFARQDILMTQKTEIMFELEETFTLKQGGRIATQFCPRCEEIIEMVSADVLSLATGSSEREIFRLIETGAIHFIEGERLVVCPGCYQRVSIGNEVRKFKEAS